MMKTTPPRSPMVIRDESQEYTLHGRSGGQQPSTEGADRTYLRLSTVGCSACFPRPDLGSRWESSTAAGAVENTSALCPAVGKRNPLPRLFGPAAERLDSPSLS